MREEDNALERLPFVRWPLGFGLLWGVEFALFSSGSLFEPLAVSRDHNDVLTLSLIAGALVAALWATLWGKRSYPWSRFMALAGAGSLAVGLLVLDMLGSPVFLEQHGVVMALGMMMGVGMGWLTVLWQVRLLTRYSRYLLPFFAAGCLIGSTLCLTMQIVSHQIAIPLAVASTVMSGLLFVWRGGLPDMMPTGGAHGVTPQATRKALSMLALPVLYACIARAIFTSTSSISYFATNDFSLTMISPRIAILLVDAAFFTAVLLGFRIGFDRLFSLVFGALGISLFFLPFVGTEYGVSLTFLTGLCCHVAYLALMVGAFEAIDQLGAERFRTIGMVNACIRLSSLLGIALSTKLFADGYDLIHLVAFTLIAIYAIGVALFVTLRRFAKNRPPAPAGPTPGALAIGRLSSEQRRELEELAQSILQAKCDMVSEQFRLTDREGEILLHLAQGKSVNRLAEDLVISTNTVKTHVKMIYAKTDVHSRQELADLVDSMEVG